MRRHADGLRRQHMSGSMPADECLHGAVVYAGAFDCLQWRRKILHPLLAS